MSSTPMATEPSDEFTAYVVEDSLTDLVEKLITSWEDQGLEAESEAPLLMEELRQVVAQSNQRVQDRSVRLLRKMKRGARR